MEIEMNVSILLVLSIFKGTLYFIFFTLSLIIYIIKHKFPFIYCIYVPTKVSRGDQH